MTPHERERRHAEFLARCFGGAVLVLIAIAVALAVR